MAFLSFAEVGSPCHGVPAVAPHGPDDLTELERQVVHLAERDPLRSIAARRRRWLHAALIGPGPVFELADPRLEALRRYVVLLRHSRPDAEAAGRGLETFGFPASLVARLASRQRTRRDSLVVRWGTARLVARARGYLTRDARKRTFTPGSDPSLVPTAAST